MTTFVVLLVGAEAADKATSATRHLTNQGAATSRDGWLASQRSKALGRDVRVVDVRRVQSYLREEPTEPIEQAVDAPLWGGWSRPQDPEACMIQSFSHPVSFLH
jgi:hypothetical protein